MALGKNKGLIIAAVVVLVLGLCGAAAAVVLIFFPFPVEGIEIPDMVGMSVAEAMDTCPVRTRVVIIESDAEAGTVVTQSHEPGTKTHHDDIVTLEIAGPLTVPDLVGMGETEAQNLIFKQGFTIGFADHDPESTEPDGTVIRQEPEAGAETMDTSISYTVAGDYATSEY